MSVKRSMYATALFAALAVPELVAAAGELALQSSDGLELANLIAVPDMREGREGLKIADGPEVLRAAGEKRRELMAAMRTRGERPRGPGTSARLRTNHLAIAKGVEFGNGTIEVEVSGQAAPGAQGGARSFVGVAWRLPDDSKTYD